VTAGTTAGTTALVVGVEQYKAGDDWRLDGPALDACRFAEWLIQRGVPAARVTLLTSPLPENQAAVDEYVRRLSCGQCGSPDQSTVRDFLTGPLADSTSDLLVIYWGGHGVVDTSEERRLFLADANSADRRNLNLTILLRALRSSSILGHQRQLLFVDACMTLVDELGWVGTMPEGGLLSGGRIQPERDQHVLLAASIGQRAGNDDRRQTGLFSEAVRCILAEMPQGAWPPDAHQLREALDARFQLLRDEGRTDQVPKHLWFLSGGEPELVFTTAPVGRPVTAASLGVRLLTFAEDQQLGKILDGAAMPSGLSAMYKEETRCLVGIVDPRRMDDLTSLVERLRGVLDPGPLFCFLVRFAAQSDPLTQQRLWGWIREVAPRWRMDLGELEELDRRLRRPVFLVRLEPDLLAQGWLVTTWSYADYDLGPVTTTDEPWGNKQLSGELSRLLHEAIELEPPPIIEFLVRWEILDKALESIPVRIADEEKPVGVVCPVVVRSLDRLDQPDCCEPWRAKWQQLIERGEAYDAEAIGWFEELPTTGEVDAMLLTERLCAALAYHRPVPASEDAILRAAVNNGTPVALWHRPDSNRQGRRHALESVLNGRALRKLPDVVRNQRAAANHPAGGPDHAGRDLVLLWDDPGRVPDTLIWQLPARGGAVS